MTKGPRNLVGIFNWSALGGLRGMRTLARDARNFLLHHHVRELHRPVAPAPQRPNPRAWPDTGLHAAWLGHSTVLLKIDGFTIITDPVLAARVGIRIGPLTFGIKRLVAPALRFSELPPIDLVLLSHAHLDHLDIPTLRRLEGRHTSVVTAHRTSDLLRPNRYARVCELRWNESVRIGPVEIRAFEVNHWGARMRNDSWRGYNGYRIQVGRYRVLFAGDTANCDTFASVRAARPFDLAIMPIGAYDPWIHYHCTPEQAWRMGNEAGAEQILPVHHRTFPLSREPLAEPLDRLLEAAGRQTDRVAVHQIGDTWAA